MKEILCPLIALSFLVACNSQDTAVVKEAKDSATATQTVDLPYKVNRTPDWEIGEPANVATAMNALKAFADNDMAGIQQYLADSVEFYADGISFKGTKDSLVKLFTGLRSNWQSIDINMHDYESVKSKARGEEWVGLWYVETDVTKDGKKDSTMYMDDVKIVNGKDRKSVV